MSNAIIITAQNIREMQNVTSDMAEAIVSSYADAGIKLHWQVWDGDEDIDKSLVVPSDQREAAFANIQKLLKAGEIVVLFEEKSESRGFEIWHRLAASDRTMAKLQKRSPQVSPEEIPCDYSETLMARKHGYIEGKQVYGADLFILEPGCQCW